MPLETATYVANLIESNPDGGDQRTTADDHLRLVKACMKRTFPSADRAYPTPEQASKIADLSLSAQAQLNALRDAPDTAKKATTANSATNASSANLATSANQLLIADLGVYGAGRSGVVALTIVARDGNGDVLARYCYSSAPNSENPGISQVMVTNGSDGYLRKSSIANFFSALAALSFTQGGWNATTLSGQGGSFYQNATNLLFGSIPDGRVPLSAVSQHSANLKTRNISSKLGTAVTLSSSAPSGGADGDVWLRY